jgi:hypothetical protein
VLLLAHSHLHEVGLSQATCQCVRASTSHGMKRCGWKHVRCCICEVQLLHLQHLVCMRMRLEAVLARYMRASACCNRTRSTHEQLLSAAVRTQVPKLFSADHVHD